eukprot:scaffold16189_cov125-Cylindrotheca_fusiformis.AAC.2
MSACPATFIGIALCVGLSRNFEPTTPPKFNFRARENARLQSWRRILYSTSRQPAQRDVVFRVVKQLQRVVTIHVLLSVIPSSFPSIDEDIKAYFLMVTRSMTMCLWSGFLLYTSLIQLVHWPSFFWLADVSQFCSICFQKWTLRMASSSQKLRHGCHSHNDLPDQLPGMVGYVRDCRIPLENQSAVEMTAEVRSDMVVASPHSTMMDRGQGHHSTVGSSVRDKDT